MKKVSVLASVAFAVIAVGTGFTQGQGNASLSGHVKDDSGKVVAGVLVKAKTGGMTVTVPSKRDGSFMISGLPRGTYEVRAERRGHVSAPQRAEVPAVAPVNFTLKPGPVDRFNLSTRELEQVLPDSPYKETLLGCEGCHSWSGLASRRAYRLENWIAGIKLMSSRGYAVGRFAEAEIPKVAEYLQANFGPGAKLPLHLLPPDPVDERGLNIKYVTFDIPSYNAMPHTAVPDGTGNVWFTEYGAGKIGVVNVKTGKMEEFVPPSPIPPSPHGITLDASGIVWFTEQSAGKIGRFDPRTKTFTEYPVPRPQNRPSRPGEVVPISDGPHTLIPDERGHIWFTIAGSSLVRRLNPETGAVTEHVIREEGSGGLYGVTRDPKNGRIWYAGIGINEVGYIDPATGKVTRFAMLTPKAGPRRLHIDSKGVAWCDLYNVSKIARIDPATGKVTEWDLPGPRDGRPYPFGIDSKDRLWTETAKDDVLIMFDPKTERFTTYLMPNKGNGLRDFYVDEEGWMWAAVWGRNQVLGFRLEEEK